MTVISGPVRRVNLSGDSFADLTTAPLVEIGRGSLTFDGDLTPEQVEAVWERMTSVDDVDQARRAAVRDLAPCCHAHAVLAAYVLGDPLPEPPLA